uniref:GSVIVT01029553001 n=1 Tax=Arundo donax TaxID=35708 RepID=A0A0A9DU98_ARUDO
MTYKMTKSSKRPFHARRCTSTAIRDRLPPAPINPSTIIHKSQVFS